MEPVDKGELRPLREDHRPLNDMLKLADISGPGIAAESSHHPLGDRCDPFAQLGSIRLGEVLNQKRNILPALP